GNEQKSAHGPSGPILAQRTGERENQSAIVLRFARSWRVLLGLCSSGLGQAACRVLLVCAGRTFVCQLVEAREPLGGQRAVLHGGAHRTAGFGAMAAVAEPAAFGERGDVVER